MKRHPRFKQKQLNFLSHGITSNLYSQICHINALHNAWQVVKNKQAGGGIDKLTLKQYNKNFPTRLNKLLKLLKSGEYVNQPYFSIQIKQAGGKIRKLGLPSVEDKIVQQAVKNVIEPIFEEKFHDFSYAYRKEKGTVKAIRRVKHIITSEGCKWAATADIISFFDTISHEVLFKHLREEIKDQRILDLIALWVKMGQVDKFNNWYDVDIGIPQGSVISPLLANFYLNKLDDFTVQQGGKFVRYADDFIFLAPTKKEVEAILASTSFFLRTQLFLEMRTNPIVETKNAVFDFLGMSFEREELNISAPSMIKFAERLNKNIVINQYGFTTKLNESLEGMADYYGKLLAQNKLENIDATLLRKLNEKLKEAYQKKKIANKRKAEKMMLSVRFISNNFRKRQHIIARSVSETLTISRHSLGVKKKIEQRKKVVRRQRFIHYHYKKTFFLFLNFYSLKIYIQIVIRARF